MADLNTALTAAELTKIILWAVCTPIAVIGAALLTMARYFLRSELDRMVSKIFITVRKEFVSIPICDIKCQELKEHIKTLESRLN